ncbi:2-Hydroxyacid oxidase 1-like [Lytechinus pictus]|uniref:2-Hydroxyacid oxidase 1-like n=1 Tax=Lytechinus pictus TaxID=7653 RepID=UPI0030B9EDDB
MDTIGNSTICRKKTCEAEDEECWPCQDLCKPNVVCLQDFEEYAKKNMTKEIFDYYAGGSGTEQSVRDNQEAFKRIRLQSYILRDVSSRDISTTILGQKVPFPFAIAPTAMQKMAHPEGEVAMARAATAMGTGMVLSAWTTCTIEEVAEASGDGLRWFHVHIFRDRSITRKIIERAERAGYKAIFVSGDTPVLGRRLRALRSEFALPSKFRLQSFPTQLEIEDGADNDSFPQYVDTQIDDAVSWDDIEWVRSISSLPIVVKGILTAADAREAVSRGVAGICVSNHGGRQLDGVPASIDVLEEVVDAVRGSSMEVFFDGGIRSGNDILKALALGARAAFIGRPALWALNYDGTAGVCKMLEILKKEFSVAMALTGSLSVADVTKDLLRRQIIYAKL